MQQTNKLLSFYLIITPKAFSPKSAHHRVKTLQYTTKNLKIFEFANYTEYDLKKKVTEIIVTKEKYWCVVELK